MGKIAANAFADADFLLDGTGDGGPPVGGSFPGAPPPEPGAGAGFALDPASQLARAQSELTRLLQSPQYKDETTELPSGAVVTTKEGTLDPLYRDRLTAAQNDVEYWRSQIVAGQKYGTERGDKLADYERARGDKLADRAVASAATGASIVTSQEATRRQGLQQEWQTGESERERAFKAGESETERAFKAGESALTRQGGLEQVTLQNQMAGDREQKQREFDAEQNALNREIQRIQNEIAAGRLNLETASTVLSKWLEGYKYSLPEGATHTPGFQPGGAVAQASRLAGVGYNPANYQAKPVAFDPAELVRQTMGR